MQNDICIIQVLDYEAQTSKKKKVLECKNCPFKDECKKAGGIDGQTN